MATTDYATALIAAGAVVVGGLLTFLGGQLNETIRRGAVRKEREQARQVELDDMQRTVLLSLQDNLVDLSARYVAWPFVDEKEQDRATLELFRLRIRLLSLAERCRDDEIREVVRGLASETETVPISTVQDPKARKVAADAFGDRFDSATARVGEVLRHYL
jgi:hypothetical protein